MPDARRRSLLLLFSVIAIVLIAIYLFFHRQASLIGGLISAGADLVTLALTYAGNSTGGADQWADDLAVEVSRAWSHRKSLLVSGTAELATRFVRKFDLEVMPNVPAPATGDWQNIDQYFLALPPQKLVILGEGGSGKTLIMLQLVTSLLSRRVERQQQRAGTDDLLRRLRRLMVTGELESNGGRAELGRVPVPISVVGWDGSVPLDQWLTDRLAATYNVPRRHGKALINQGYLLPVLDGLDEASGSGTSAHAPLRILYRLNHDYGITDGTGRRPVVLTSRTGAYENLPPTRDLQENRRLAEAVVVSMIPLTRGEVLASLTSQAQLDNIALQPLIVEIEEGRAELVASALASPLILALAMRVARAGRLDLDHLGRLTTEGDVRRYFISEYPGSTATLYPVKFGRRADMSRRERALDASQARDEAHYDVRSVQRWLFYIASFLSSRAAATAPGSLFHPEFSPSDLWEVAELHDRRVRRAHMTIACVVAAITGTFGAEVADGRAGYLYWLVATILAGLFALRVGLPRAPKLSRVDFRRLAQGKSASYLLPMVVLTGVLTGLLGFHVSGEMSVGITEGVAGLALAALLAGRSRGVARAVQPLDGLSNDLRFGVVVGIVGAIAIGFPGGLTGGLWSHLHLTHALSRPGSEALAFVVAVPCGVVLGSGAWVRLQLAALLSGNDFLPRQPITFLRWAEATGLLRAAGIKYQFRHDDLRGWLMSAGPELPGDD